MDRAFGGLPQVQLVMEDDVTDNIEPCGPGGPPAAGCNKQQR